MKRWLIGLVPVALIVVILAYVLGSHVIPQSAQDNFANAAIPHDTSSLPDDNAASALPESPVNTQAFSPLPDNAATPAPTPMPAPSAANDADAESHNGDRSDDGDQDAEAQAQAEIGATIRRATIAALDSGEPTHWHKDGLQGDIVVSEPQDDGQDGSCRTVTATIGTADDRKQSGDHVWCEGGDSDEWRPQER